MSTKNKPVFKTRLDTMGQQPSATPGIDAYNALFGLPGNAGAFNSKNICTLPLTALAEWPDQPFRPQRPEKFTELCDSMDKNGLIMPIIVRQLPIDPQGYQILAGHNRVRAARKLGWEKIDAIVVAADDVQATLIMLDTNLAQRDELLPSEKARAYKMRLEALRRKAGRPKNNSAQIEPNYAETTGEKNVAQFEPNFKRSSEALAAQTGDSRASIQRLIRLTSLIQALVEKVDRKELPLNAGVSLSYLPEEEQMAASDFLLSNPDCHLTLEQAEELKRYSAEIAPVDAAALRQLFGLPLPVVQPEPDRTPPSAACDVQDEPKEEAETMPFKPPTPIRKAVQHAKPVKPAGLLPKAPKLKFTAAQQAEIFSLLPDDCSDCIDIVDYILEALKAFKT